MLFTVLTRHVRPPISATDSLSGVDSRGALEFSPEMIDGINEQFRGDGRAILGRLSFEIGLSNLRSPESLRLEHNRETGELAIVSGHRVSATILDDLVRRLSNTTTTENGELLSLGVSDNGSGRITIRPSLSLNPEFLARIGNLALPVAGVPQQLPPVQPNNQPPPAPQNNEN